MAHLTRRHEKRIALTTIVDEGMVYGTMGADHCRLHVTSDTTPYLYTVSMTREEAEWLHNFLTRFLAKTEGEC